MRGTRSAISNAPSTGGMAAVAAVTSGVLPRGLPSELIVRWDPVAVVSFELGLGHAHSRARAGLGGSNAAADVLIEAIRHAKHPAE